MARKFKQPVNVSMLPDYGTDEIKLIKEATVLNRSCIQALLYQIQKRNFLLKNRKKASKTFFEYCQKFASRISYSTLTQISYKVHYVYLQDCFFIELSQQGVLSKPDDIDEISNYTVVYFCVEVVVCLFCKVQPAKYYYG